MAQPREMSNGVAREMGEGDGGGNLTRPGGNGNFGGRENEILFSKTGRCAGSEVGGIDVATCERLHRYRTGRIGRTESDPRVGSMELRVWARIWFLAQQRLANAFII